MSEFLQRAVNNTVWIGGSSIGAGVLGFLVSTTTVKFMGLPQAGFAVAVLSLVAIFSTLSGFGISNALVFQISQRRNQEESARARGSLEAALLVALIVGGVGGCGLWAADDLIIDFSNWDGPRGDARIFCALSGLAFATAQLGNPHQSAIEGALRYDLRGLIILSTLIFQALATVILLWAWPSLIVLAAINVATALLRTLASAWASAHVLGFVARPKWSSAALRGVWRYSRWFYFASLFALGFSGFDRMTLVTQFGSALLPIYVLARRFYEVAHDILTSQTAYFVPMISTILSEGDGTAVDLDDRLKWFVAALAAWLYAGVLLIGPGLLVLSVSPEFARSARVPLLIMAVVGFLHAQAIVPFYFAQAEGRPVWGFGLNAACALSVPAMMLLGRSIGFLGAIAGQLTIGIASILFILLYSFRTGKLDLARVWTPIARPSVLFALAMALYFAWLTDRFSLMWLAGLGAAFLALYFPVLCRMERRETRRVDTLHRAVVIAETRSGPLAALVRLFVRWTFGITPSLTQGSR